MVDMAALTSSHKERLDQCKDALINESAEAALAKMKSLLTPEVVADMKTKYDSVPEAERDETLKAVYTKVKDYLNKECPGKEAQVEEFLQGVRTLREALKSQ